MSWPLIPLKDCCDIVSGSTPRSNQPQFWNGTIPWITPKDLSIQDQKFLERGERCITQEGLSSCSTQLLPKGTVLFSSRAPIGLVAIAAQELCTNQGFKNLVPRSKVDSNYLYWVMKSKSPEIDSMGRGATFREVSKELVGNVKVPLPPLAEQRRIAAILDKADEIRRKREKAIELTDSFLRSVFVEMFGDPVTNPKGWPETALGENFEKIDSGWSPVCLDRPAQPGEWGVLKLGSVANGVFIGGENKALPAEHTPRPEIEVKMGDLLFTRKNTYELVGACAYVFETRSKLMLPDLIFRLPIANSSSLTPIYLSGLLNSHSMRHKIKKTASGTAGSMPNISKARLANMIVPCPPKALQLKYEDLVRQTRATNEYLLRAAVDCSSLFGSLQQRLFVHPGSERAIGSKPVTERQAHALQL